MSNEYSRNIKDAAKQVVSALPAANANKTTTPIDLEQVVGGQLDNVQFEIAIPATPALVEAKSITVKVYDGATSDSLAVVDPLIQTTVTGGTGGAGAAKTVRFRLPPTARRYVALYLAVENGGGDNTGVDVTFSALF